MCIYMSWVFLWLYLFDKFLVEFLGDLSFVKFPSKNVVPFTGTPVVQDITTLIAQKL